MIIGDMATAAVSERFTVQKGVQVLLNTSRGRVLAGIAVAIPAIAYIDWHWISISLGGLYIFPMLFAATVLSSRATVGLALLCAILRCCFDDSHFAYQYAIRFSTSFATYVISGLFIVAVMRKREMALEHLALITREQRLRNEAQERLKTLVESSPAAILTLNQKGIVLAANHAANVLFGLEGDRTLEGLSIRPYMPVLTEAVRLGTGGKALRTSAQSQGRRQNGEIFLADLWFSTYPTGDGTQLAAIVVDSSEEMRDREQENLRQLSNHSRLVAAAVLHEVRNLCSAISVVYANLKDRNEPCRVEEIQGLEALITGLSRVASLELYGRERGSLEGVPLQQVLDDLRIIIEPSWQEIGGSVFWKVPDSTLRVLADRYGLMQVFLNLAQNSHRAVQASAARNLSIRVETCNQRAVLRFEDTGCGVRDPQRLFQPFQQGADVTGLGLFISRVLVRSYGGELRFQPVETGSSFVIELPLFAGRKTYA